MTEGLRELMKVWRWRGTDWPSPDSIKCADELEAALAEAGRQEGTASYVERDVLGRFCLRQRAAFNDEYEDDLGHSKLWDCLNELEDIVRLSGATAEAASPGEASRPQEPIEVEPGELIKCGYCARGKRAFIAGGAPCHHNQAGQIVMCPSELVEASRLASPPATREVELDTAGFEQTRETDLAASLPVEPLPSAEDVRGILAVSPPATTPTCGEHGPMDLVYAQHRCRTCGSVDELAEPIAVSPPETEQAHDPELCGCENHADWCPFNPNATQVEPNSAAKDVIAAAQAILEMYGPSTEYGHEAQATWRNLEIALAAHGSRAVPRGKET